MKNKLSTVTVAALLSVGIQAQSQVLPEPLIQAARKAVASNPEVQSRWHGFQAASDERNVARGGYFPQIDVRASTGNEDRTSPVLASTRYNFNMAQITLNQMLFDGLFTANEVKRLGYAKLTRYYELMEASETVALETVRAYADVLRYRELVEAATKNYAEHKMTAALVEERAASGVGRRVDAEQAMGRLALAESNLLTELTNLHDVSARYLRLVGEKPAETLPALPDQFSFGPLPANSQALLREGLPTSPTLNAALENVRAARTAIESRKAAYAPRVDIRAYASRDNDVLGVLGKTNVNGVELVLNYNLYRGGADQSRERQAVNLHEQARDLKEKACRDVRQTLSIAYSDVTSLNDQLRYIGQHRLSTEKANQAYRQQFELGQRTLLDLLDSQNEYFQASRSYIETHYNQVIAQARTLSGMGQLVQAMNVVRPDAPTAQDAGQDRTTVDAADLCLLDEMAVDTVEKIKAGIVVPVRTRAVAAPPSPVPSKTSFSADTLFDFDKYTLKTEGKREIDTLVSKIKDSKFDILVAVGHTDSVGSDTYNQRLSLRRAEAVKAYLVSVGIDRQRIRVEGKGESQPVADNATPEGRAKNRRVEIEVIAQAPAK
jgi:adhesin transport system outer membrane protein